MSKFGKEVALLLRNDTEWECNKYHLIHRPTGLDLWISNGAWFFDVADFRGSLGPLERHWIWHTQARQLVAMLKPHEPSATENRASAWKIIKRPNAKSEGADAALSRTLPLD